MDYNLNGYESDDLIIDMKYDENFDNLLSNNPNYSNNYYNIYDNFFDHLEDENIFYIILDNLNIKYVLKLRTTDKYFFKIINQYFFLNNHKNIINNIIYSYSYMVEIIYNKMMLNEIIFFLNNYYLKKCSYNLNFIPEKYNNIFDMIKNLRIIVKEKHHIQIKKIVKYLNYYKLYEINNKYYICRCNDCKYNYKMKWFYLIKRIVFHLRKAVLLKN